MFARVYPRLRAAGSKSPGPEVVARAIVAAADDTSHKLRWKPNGALIMFARDLAGPNLYVRAVRRILRVPRQPD